MNPTNIADLSGVSPQQTFLESHPEKPSATDPLYVSRFTATHSDQSQSHTVVGVHIILAPGHPNGLWEAFHVDRSTRTLDPKNPRAATRSLSILCDTLEIRGELSVPEAEVAVFARRLVWATADAAINTSPLSWAVPKARNAFGSTPGENGASGRHAGAYRIFVSEVSPAGDPRPRLVALGGRGQDPGAGLDGQPGRSMSAFSKVPFTIVDTGISTSKATITFNPVAVYIDYVWKWGARWAPIRVASGTHGENAFPGNGGNALAPGIPGDGGNGGGLTTNLEALVPTLRNAGGAAGTRERDYRGGSPGVPTSCSKYKVTLWENLGGTDNASHDVKRTASNTSKKGTDAKAQDAPRGPGSASEPVIEPEAHAWLHPLGLQKTLEYARDLFLAGDRTEVEDLLQTYEAALALPPPENGAWDAGGAAQWMAAQSEVAAMLQRLRGHLDYFGNAAGFTPLLSLQGTIQLYAEETRRALRTLLLVGWIDARAREVREAADALGEAVTGLSDDSRQAADQVTRAETAIREVTGRIDALEQELGAMGNRLAILRNRLLSQAQNDLEKQAQIKFAIKMAAAVCQVVPVGQPALGAVGSLAGVAADFIGDDGTGAPDTVSKLGDVFTKARAAAKKADAAARKAEKEKGSGSAKDAESAKAGASAWAQVGDGLGPALSQVSHGLKALQVPRSEVEAELQRLESESEEWNSLVRDIRDLNERKAAFVRDLEGALQSLGEGYARISSNAAAVFTLQQARGKDLGRLNPAAAGFARQMGQQSRLTLLWYLYLMVKAYETTVLKPITVDWKLTEVADKINELLKPEEGFDAARLDRQAAALEPVYQKNLDTVRRRLLEDFSFNESTITLQLGLSGRQTPDLLAALNESGAATIDPVAFGLVLPDRQLARLNRVILKQIEFDPARPALPETHNLVVSLQPARKGTIRKAEALYAVYSDLPPQWSWTCLASGEVRASEPSRGAEDMLNLLLGGGAERIKQKVSMPPVWSDLSIRVLYSPALTAAERPRIAKLYFEFGCDVTAAPDHQRVVNVRSLGAAAGAVIACSPDLADRGDGFDRMIRIFSKGATVRLGVPASAAGSAFEAWDIVGGRTSRMGVKETAVDIQVDDHVLARCQWRRLQEPVAPIVLSRNLQPEALAELAERHGDEAVRRELKTFLATPPPARNLPMRAAAAEGAPVVGVIPTLRDADVLEERTDGWTLSNYRGVVGWVRTES